MGALWPLCAALALATCDGGGPPLPLDPPGQPADGPAPLAPTLVELTFRQGVDDYEGTRDLHLSMPAQFHNAGHPESQFATDPHNPIMEWALEDTAGEVYLTQTSNALQRGWGDAVALLRFGDIFGAAASQIPLGAEIFSATLALRAHRSGDPAAVHRILKPWDDHTTWTTFGPHPGPDLGWDVTHQVEAVTKGGWKQTSVDVTPSLLCWAGDPRLNLGWAFVPTTARDVIHIDDSPQGTISKVKVHLKIKTASRGQIVATLRHGNHTAVLLNHLGRAPCGSHSGQWAPDLDVVLDDAAAVDVHKAPGNVSPLTGTYRPDGVCDPSPLCTPQGGGLCGETADGDWVLTLNDDWNNVGPPAQLEQWSVELHDGKTWKTYTSNAAVTIPKRHSGSRDETRVWTSEAPLVQDRPALTVKFRPALAFDPPSLRLWPNSGGHKVTLRRPAQFDGAVQAEVLSDKPEIIDVPDGQVSFAAQDTGAHTVVLEAGKPGQMVVRAVGDAGVGEGYLGVEVGYFGPTATPPGIYRGVQTDEVAWTLSIPAGSNQLAPVTLTVKSADPALVLPGGKAELQVVFAKGGPAQQTVQLKLGGLTGSTSLAVAEDSGVMPGLEVPVQISAQSPVEYDVLVPPYVQIGGATLGAESAHVEVTWLTTVRREGGPTADHFTFEYRHAGDGPWILHPLAPPLPGDSTSRLHQRVLLDDLPPDLALEYRVRKWRHGQAKPVESWQSGLQTRRSGAFRFTAFGNSGTGSQAQLDVAARLATLGTDLHLLLGDFAYWTGEYEHYPRRVFAPYAKVFAARPVAYTPGNHEGPYQQVAPMYFHVPANGTPGHPERQDYAFDYGHARFFSMHYSLEGTTITPAAGAWLKAQIAASPKTWNIVFTHEPPVTRDPYKIDRQEAPQVRDVLLRAAVEAGADLFIAGAVHSYQRYRPITAVTDTKPFVTAASCPQGYGTTLVYPGAGAWVRTPQKPVPAQLDDPMERYILKTGVGVFDVGPETLTIRYVDVNGVERDTLVRKKCGTPADCPCP